MVSFAGFCPPPGVCRQGPIRSAAITSTGAHLILLISLSIPRCERARKSIAVRYHLPLRNALFPRTGCSSYARAERRAVIGGATSRGERGERNAPTGFAHHEALRRRDRGRRPEGARGPVAEPALRRTAAARRRRACPRDRAAGSSSRRAALQPRREAARAAAR